MTTEFATPAVARAAVHQASIKLPEGMLEEASMVLHHNAARTGFTFLSKRLRWDGPGENRNPWQDVAIGIATLGHSLKLHVVPAMANHDAYIAQHAFKFQKRVTTALEFLHCAHIDLDIYRAEKFVGRPTSYVIDSLLRTLDAWKIPHPSWIVHSGRGLQIKWLFDAPVPANALPRWTCAHRHLVTEVLGDFAADIKAILPTQVMRLVGSINQKSNTPAVIAWTNGSANKPQRISFDAWASAVLPYTRTEVKEFRARVAEIQRQQAEFAENTRRANAARGITHESAARKAAWEQVAASLGVQAKNLVAMDDLVAGEIWQRRLKVMETLHQVRGHSAGGVTEGKRNSWVWLAANALAWINRDRPDALLTDLTAWVQEFTPSLSEKEAQESASSVLKRAKQRQGFGSGLYRMSEQRFERELEITDDERELVKATQAQERAERAAVRAKWNVGAMGFQKMSGLSVDEYLAETKRRQAEAAKHAVATRKTKWAEGKPWEAAGISKATWYRLQARNK